MIRFAAVTKRYPNGHEALAEVSFELGDGEMAFLTGHSGAGKSTLLRLIALLERPTRGQVFIGGRNLTRL
ncbi:MAG: ATP-binding cassette domain-containing protein, partial [Gammaproteobacteria bacterium]